MKRRIILIVLAIIIIAAAAAIYIKSRQDQLYQKSLFKMVSVKKSDISDKVSTTGTLMAQNSFSQYFETGKVTKLQKKLGDEVKKEDELCEVEVTSAITGTTTKIIKSEADGTITQLNIKEGQAYNGMTPAFVIDDLNLQKVQLRLSKNDSYKIKVGQSAIVKVNDDEHKGTVSEISPVAVQFQTVQGQESSLVVDVKLDSKIPDVKIGFDVDCDILLEELKDVFVLPLQCIIANSDASTHIFLNDDGIAKKKEVKLGLVSGSDVQILEGVSDGDKIILNPNNDLKDGDKVVDEDKK